MSEERVLPKKPKKVTDISPVEAVHNKGSHRDGYESKGSQRVGNADNALVDLLLLSHRNREHDEERLKILGGEGMTEERCSKCNAKITDLRIRSGDCCRWVVMR